MASLDKANVSQDQTHPSNHQTDPKSPSSSSTSAQNQQSFQAATEVLDTNELFHLIIAEVPREYRLSIRGVSKTWEAAVTKVGYTLKPSGYQKINNTGYLDLPVVSSIATFEINPAFPAGKVVHTFEASHGRMLASLVKPKLPRWNMPYRRVRKGTPEYCQRRVPSVSETAGHEHEFITNPPLTQLLMSLGPCGHDVAILRVRGGIRIGDLAEYSEKMLNLPGNPFPKFWWMFCRKSGGELTGE